MKTLLLNPPSFPNFDGGASSRWPATREIASHWYPVWLSYPAGLIKDCRLLDASPHKITSEATIGIAKTYDFVAIYTSTPGWRNDVRLAEMMKAAKPDLKIAFVGPPVTSQPDAALKASESIDFVIRKEIDYPLAEFAEGKPLDQIKNVSFRKQGRIIHNEERPPVDDLDSLPWATDIYKRDLDITKYNVPFLLNPYLSFYTSRGCPARCTFCLWPQTVSGHAWRTRSASDVAAEFKHAWKLFPNLEEVFFDDDTFAWAKKRTLEVCEQLKPIKKTWSCTSRAHTDYETLKAMRDAGCRLLIVGFESGDPQILKNIKKGTTVQQGREFMKNCKKLGIAVHGDFIIGLPGETPESIERTVKYAEELDCETIQVSIAHSYPGTELHDLFSGSAPRSFLLNDIKDQAENLLGGAKFDQIGDINAIKYLLTKSVTNAEQSVSGSPVPCTAPSTCIDPKNVDNILSAVNGNTNFITDIQDDVTAIKAPSGITASNIVDRLRTQTCAGCHQFSDTKQGPVGFDDKDGLGGGAHWPTKACGDYGPSCTLGSFLITDKSKSHPPMQFTQVSEAVLVPSASDGDGHWRYAISSTVECMLDFREKFMKAALGMAATSANNCPQ
jgi:hopanoid biosynthesis associated radical SAM protein HpnJ